MSAKKCVIALPDFEVLKKQPKVPHVARTVAERDVPNEYGALIKFKVQQNRKGNEWWISASLHGMRMSNTLHTGKLEKAKEWIAAVEKGQVCIKK